MKAKKLPWSVKETRHGCYTVVNCDGEAIFLVESRMPHQQALELAQIAAAIPEMIIALKQADKALLISCPDSSCRGPVAGPKAWEKIKTATAAVIKALAKASGE